MCSHLARKPVCVCVCVCEQETPTHLDTNPASMFLHYHHAPRNPCVNYLHSVILTLAVSDAELQAKYNICGRIKYSKV